MTADVAGLDDELLHQLNDTASGCIHAYRVFLWTGRSARGQQHSSGTNLSTRARSMPARKLRTSTTKPFLSGRVPQRRLTYHDHDGRARRPQVAWL